MTKKKPEHYVDNKQFNKDMIAFSDACHDAEESGDTKASVPIPDRVASNIMAICTRLSFRPNFVNYTFREDMVGDGIENCLKYIRNWDAKAETKSGYPNAFGYFTQIAFFAFVRRIKKEEKMTIIKGKYVTKLFDPSFHEDFDYSENEKATLVGIDSRLDYLQDVYKKSLEDKPEKSNFTGTIPNNRHGKKKPAEKSGRKKTLRRFL